jgi:4-amino-4-deoxy-L-arabinose transferase-like glycosyltransferase
VKIELSKKEKWIVLLLSLAAIAVHLINLGWMPLMADEAIRGTVAFEMMKSNDYIVPTIWGEFYYRKPPFYNWIVIGFFKAFDSYSEFVFRLPSVIPLFLFGVVIWFVSRRHIGEKAGIIAAFGFILSGRLLTRDSMLGHIDIAFSLLTFIGFFVVYYYHKRKQYFLLFLISYVLAAIGTLMKGLPSILFQVFTVGAWFLYMRDWKKLFSLSHVFGVLSYVAIVGGYFFLYSQYNGLDKYFGELYGQAAMRTVVDRPWYDGIVNIFTFPFENFGHLFPTSLIFLFALRKGIIKQWLGNDFTAFVAITLAVNLIPYWLSPGYYPRYLFMLYPLAFLLGADAMMRFQKSSPKTNRVFEGVFLTAGVLVTLSFVAAFFIPELYQMSFFVPSVLLCLVLGAALLALWFKQSEQRVYLAFAFVILFRLGFDLCVLPYRTEVTGTKSNYRKDQSEKILALTGEKDLVMYSKTPLFIDYAYYLGVGKDAIIYRITDPLPNALYLVDDNRLPQLKGAKVIYRFDSKYDNIFVNLVEWSGAPD